MKKLSEPEKIKHKMCSYWWPSFFTNSIFSDDELFIVSKCTQFYECILSGKYFLRQLPLILLQQFHFLLTNQAWKNEVFQGRIMS